MIFNALISGGGTKLAQGTVTAASRAVTVSGLSFTPNKVFLMAQSVSTSSGTVYCSLNTSALTQGHTNIREITLTFTADGFTAIPTETSKKYYGDYDWVAWKE